MKKQYLECAKIVTTHGIRGEVKALPWSDSPEFLLNFTALYLNKGAEKLEIEKAHVHKNMVLIKIKGIDTMDDAIPLKGKILYVNREDVPMAEGEYFIQDLLGVAAYDVDTHKNYGKIVDVLKTGANDVYVLEDENKKQRLVPVIPSVVLNIDIEAQTMQIRPLEGLFEDEN